MLLFALTAAALAVQSIPAGVPLRVALEHRVHIKHTNQPVAGRLIEPIYLVDRIVVPAGSTVEGHVAEIGGVPFMRRLTCFLNGNLTPPRDVRAQFDALLLPGGERFPLKTGLTGGTAHTQRIVKRGKEPDPNDVDQSALLAYKTPGKWRRLLNYGLGMLPYHQQAWSAGTLFIAALAEPLPAPVVSLPLPASTQSSELRARLLTPLNSATAQHGSLVEAVVTRPQFSSDHRLLIPEGAHLLGEVVQAQKARFFHRNGKLLFEFRQIQVAAAPAQSIKGYLDGLEADFNTHLALDSEGGAAPKSPKTRVIFPLIASAVAGLSFHQDFNSKGIPDQDAGGRAESGAVGLGVIGTLLTQFGPRAFASSIAIMGAAPSIYFTFIARGENVVLHENTPVTVSLGAR